MKKVTKILLIIGSVLMVSGIILYTTMFFTGKNNATSSQKQSIYQLEPINTIDIDVVETDVEIIKAKGIQSRLEIDETENVYHKVSVNNGVLKIERQSKYYPFEWILPSFHLDMCIKLYLVEDIYNSIDIDMVSGKLNISYIDTQELNINQVSGNINLSNINSNNVDINSVSGLINLDNIESKNTLKTNSVSGNIELNNVESNIINAESVSSNISLILKSGKQIKTSTISGKVNKPETIESNGTCNVKTISGNIEIKVA